MNKRLSKSASILVQVMLTACLFYVLTGGAALLDWTQVPRWKKILMLTTYAAAFVCAGTAILLYYKDREKLVSLQPFRLIHSFFSLSPVLSVGILFISFLATQWSQQLAMHYGLETHLWDFGFFDQILWNTAHGNGLITSVRGGIHVFAEHFKPILFLIAPLYLWQSKVWFFLASTDLPLASSLIAVYLIARKVTGSHANALTLTFCVFFYSPLVSGTNFLYHTQMLIDPFLLWGFYFILKDRRLWAFVFFVFALSCKESAVPDLLGIGLFLFAQKRKTAGGLAAMLSLVWLLSFIFWIEPHFRIASHFRTKWTFFSAWTHPTMQTLSMLWNSPNPVAFLFKIFAPFLFLSFACPKGWLLLGPSLLFRLMSQVPGLRSTTCHYMGGAEALVFISAIYGFAAWTRSGSPERLKSLFSRIIAVFRDPGLVRILVIVAAVLCAGCPQLVVIDRFLEKASRPENQRVIRVLDSIASNYSVMATDNLAGHVSHRTHMYAFCEMFPKTPYVDLAKHPDLVVYDTRKDTGCTAATLKDYLGQGYSQIYETDYLRIYSQPKREGLDPDKLRNEWKAIASRPTIPYQDISRFWYRTFVALGGVLFITGVTLFSRKGGRISV